MSQEQKENDGAARRSLAGRPGSARALLRRQVPAEEEAAGPRPHQRQARLAGCGGRDVFQEAGEERVGDRVGVIGIGGRDHLDHLEQRGDFRRGEIGDPGEVEIPELGAHRMRREPAVHDEIRVGEALAEGGKELVKPTAERDGVGGSLRPEEGHDDAMPPPDGAVKSALGLCVRGADRDELAGGRLRVGHGAFLSGWGGRRAPPPKSMLLAARDKRPGPMVPTVRVGRWQGRRAVASQVEGCWWGTQAADRLRQPWIGAMACDLIVTYWGGSFRLPSVVAGTEMRFPGYGRPQSVSKTANTARIFMVPFLGGHKIDGAQRPHP